MVADDNNDPVYFKILRELFRALKREGGPLVEKVGFGRSRSSDMLQLADMVCGSVVRWHQGEEGYLDLIQNVEGTVIDLYEKKRGPARRPALI